MKEIKAPNKIIGDKLLFLSGSIEMGKAEDWQDKVIRLLDDTDWIILNPRRDDWDSSWIEDIDNSQFRQQVEWELKGLERAKKIIVYFDVRTRSPITLFELGLFLDSSKLIVICPDGFYRKGNVDIVCNRYNILQVSSIEEAVRRLNV